MKANFKDNVYVSTFLTKVGYSGLMFLVSIILTRYLGVENKGNYTWYINLATMIATVAGLGIYQSIAYFKRQGRQNINQEYADTFVVQGVLYAILSVVLFWVFRDEKVIAVCLLVLVDNLAQQFNMLALIGDIRKRNNALLFGAVIYFVLSCGLLMFVESSPFYAIVVYGLVKVYYTYAYYRIVYEGKHRIHVSLNCTLEKMRFGCLPMFSLLLVTINYKIDVIMLKEFQNITDAELSYYSAGVSIAEVAWFLPDVFKEVMFSKTANEDAIEDVKSVIRVSNAILSVLIIIGAICGKIAIGVLYGEVFLPAYPVMVVLLCGVPVMSWFKIINTLYTAQGRRTIGFVVLAVSAIVNVVLNVILIPYFGIMGAAIASCGSYAACGLLFLLSFSRNTRTPLGKMLLPNKNDFRVLLKK